MIVKKLNVQDIAKLLLADDIRIEDHFPGDKGELVQWLIQSVDYPGMFIWGALNEGGELTGLLVAISNVARPVSDTVSVMFFHASPDFETNVELKDVLDGWGRGLGASGVNFVCKDIGAFKKYGATERAIIGGWAI